MNDQERMDRLWMAGVRPSVVSLAQIQRDERGFLYFLNIDLQLGTDAVVNAFRAPGRLQTLIEVALAETARTIEAHLTQMHEEKLARDATGMRAAREVPAELQGLADQMGRLEKIGSSWNDPEDEDRGDDKQWVEDVDE